MDALSSMDGKSIEALHADGRAVKRAVRTTRPSTRAEHSMPGRSPVRRYFDPLKFKKLLNSGHPKTLFSSSLTAREWVCKSTDPRHDRDWNADWADWAYIELNPEINHPNSTSKKNSLSEVKGCPKTTGLGKVLVCMYQYSRSVGLRTPEECQSLAVHQCNFQQWSSRKHRRAKESTTQQSRSWFQWSHFFCMNTP